MEIRALERLPPPMFYYRTNNSTIITGAPDKKRRDATFYFYDKSCSFSTVCPPKASNIYSLSRGNIIATIVIVVPICGYDQLLYKGTNNDVRQKFPTQLEDSVSLFRSVFLRKCARSSKIIVIFSKLDLLAEKLRIIPFGNYCKEYKGPGNDSACVIGFIRNIFIDIAKENGKEITTVTANLTDTETVKSITELILNRRWEPHFSLKENNPAESGAPKMIGSDNEKWTGLRENAKSPEKRRKESIYEVIY